MSEKPPKRYLDRTSPPHISTLIFLAGLSALAMNVFLPSLPAMATYFQTDYWVLQLSIAVYLGVNAVMQIIIGPVSDNLGRRPVILWGVAIFSVATLGCILSTSAPVFLFFRMLQAAIVTAMVLSRAIVRDMVPANEAASMIGYVSMGMAVVPMLGPVVGGFLDANFGWKASFWLMAACGAAMFWICWRDLGETKASTGETLMQQFSHYPELLTSPRFWGYSMASGLSTGAFFAYLGGAPFVGTKIFGMSSAELGFFFGAPALGYFTGNFASARLSVRMGVNRMVIAGTIFGVIGSGSTLLAFLTGHDTPLSFFGFVTIVGLGNGLVIPNATSGMLSIRPHLAGTASGLGGAIMVGLGAALSAIAGIVLGDGLTAMPLLLLMFATSAGGLLAAMSVVWRERALGLHLR